MWINLQHIPNSHKCQGEFTVLTICPPVCSTTDNSCKTFFKTCMTALSRLQCSPWQESCKLLYTDVWYPSGRDNPRDFFQWNFWRLFMLEKQTSSWEIDTFYQELSRQKHVFRDFWSKWRETHPVVVNSPMFWTLARTRRCKFKYFLCWIHCMNKMPEQKPFTTFSHMPGEWFCCQIFLYRCLAISRPTKQNNLKIHQSWKEYVTCWLGCSSFFPSSPYSS